MSSDRIDDISAAGVRRLQIGKLYTMRTTTAKLPPPIGGIELEMLFDILIRSWGFHVDHRGRPYLELTFLVNQ